MGVGVFLFPVYVKGTTTACDIRCRENGLSRVIYGTNDQKKNAMQQMPSTTCSDVQSIIFVTLELERKKDV